MGSYEGIGLLGFLIGVLIYSLFKVPGVVVFAACFVGLGSVAVSIWIARRHGSHARITLFWCVLFTCFALGLLRNYLNNAREPTHELDQSLGVRVTYRGVIVDDPQASGEKKRILFHPEDAKGNISFTVPMYPTLSYGDFISVSGILVKPEAFLSDNGRLFDYPSYLALQDVYYQIQLPHVKLISRGEVNGRGSWVKKKLFAIKHTFLERLSVLFPEPHSALLAGLLIGEKRSLGKDLQDEFRRAGIIHIVVLSGFNVAIIGHAMMRLLSFLPKRAATIVGIAFISLFTIMTGASATVVRSAMMSSFALLADASYRTYEVTRALFLVAFLMVLYDPRILAFDPSFQLSFLSTLGLIFISPLVERRLIWVHEKVRAIIVATLSTQIFVLPFLLYSMGDISLVAPIVNVLVLPAIPLTMLFGLITALLPSILSLPFMAATYGLLEYELSIVHFFANLSSATLPVAYFPGWLMITCYAVFGTLLWRRYYHTKKE